MATVKELLLDRLRTALGPDEQLDLDIARVLAPSVIVARQNDDGSQSPFTYWKYTANLDHARRLVEATLPGWWWKCGTCGLSDDACIAPDYNSPIHGERLHREFPLVLREPFDEGFDVDRRPSGNVAIALLESLFEALVYIEEAN